MIVVDTNVASELMRPAPAMAVRTWLALHAADELYTTAVTVAEIRYGLEHLDDGRRRELLRAADDVLTAFSDFILPFDARAAVHYAQIVTRRERLGLPIEGFDAQIAAICTSAGATLATRNIKDFLETGVDLIDPWSPA